MGQDPLLLRLRPGPGSFEALKGIHEGEFADLLPENRGAGRSLSSLTADRFRSRRTSVVTWWSLPETSSLSKGSSRRQEDAEFCPEMQGQVVDNVEHCSLLCVGHD